MLQIGCFNYIKARCTNCGTTVRFQSKSGSCEMKEYWIDHMPSGDIAGIRGDTEICDGCNQEVNISEPPLPKQDFSDLVY